RMLAVAVGAGVAAEVRRRRPDGQAGLVELVLDPECEREGIARLGVDDVLHHDPGGLALGGTPRRPAHQAVDRVSVLGLGERQVVAAAVELVGAVLDAVRPRNEDLAASRRGQVARAVAVEDVSAVDRVRPQPAPDLDDNGLLAAERELELLAGRRDRHMDLCHAIRSRRGSPTRSELAIAVSAGLTAPIDGKTLVSTT